MLEAGHSLKGTLDEVGTGGGKNLGGLELLLRASLFLTWIQTSSGTSLVLTSSRTKAKSVSDAAG